MDIELLEETSDTENEIEEDIKFQVSDDTYRNTSLSPQASFILESYLKLDLLSKGVPTPPPELS